MIQRLITHVLDCISTHWVTILSIASFCFLCGTLYLLVDFGNGLGIGSCTANSFRDNVIVEAVVGGLFLFAPIVVGYQLGKRSREIAFYSNIREVVEEIKALRKAETDVPHTKAMTQETARSLVKAISAAMGREILEESWWRFEVEPLSITVEKKPCGICGLDADLDLKKEKCDNCKLNCFIWEEKSR